MVLTKKVVQTELDEALYDIVLRAARSRGLSLKEATREALRAWASRDGDLLEDPLFDASWGFKGEVKTDSSKVDSVVYRRRRR